jgi:hypothetical protein
MQQDDARQTVLFEASRDMYKKVRTLLQNTNVRSKHWCIICVIIWAVCRRVLNVKDRVS